ncbi:hypothetical protein CAC42_7354 [Sphaceloma murrayae]|uniref:Uncharacterized protein n=1 Tax=Sphaceloma murrayae TaxID=2082308 RepID=A0A2K1QX22_9PEZI|nr:hypothetical protein CAC42_7354 [Sphaceloma murrayae]
MLEQDVSPLTELEIRQLSLGGFEIGALDPEKGVLRALPILLVRLLATIRTSSFGLSHRAAACNLLSAALLATSDQEGLIAILWSDQLWIQSMETLLRSFSALKLKSTRQLLNSLLLILSRYKDDPGTTSTYTWLLTELSTVLRDGPTHAAPKAHLSVLSMAMEKRIVSVQDVCMVAEPRAESDLGPSGALESFFRRLLPLAVLDDLGPSLAKVITAALRWNTGSESVNTAVVKPLVSSYDDDQILRDCYRHYILPAIIGKSFDCFSSLLDGLRLDQHLGNVGWSLSPMDHIETTERDLLVNCLLVGAAQDMVVVTRSAAMIERNFRKRKLMFPLNMAESMLQDESKTFRIGALFLLIGDSISIEPMSAATLTILLRHIPAMFADTDADFRSSVFSMLQRLIDRLRSSSCALLRRQSPHLALHQSFLLDFVQLLNTELRPPASYQRHVCALQALKMLARSGMDPLVKPLSWSKGARSQLSFNFKLDLFGNDTIDALLALLMDPFEEVRTLSFSILQMTLKVEVDVANIRQRNHSHSTPDMNIIDLGLMLDNVQTLAARTGRADHADAAGRLYGLIFSLGPAIARDHTDSAWWSSRQNTLSHLIHRSQEMLKALQHSPSQSMHSLPFHACLIAIRYILDQADTPMPDAATSLSPEIIRQLINISTRTWTTMRPILCDDAPEGYLPTGIEEETLDNDIDTKDLLSFAWRALKESSLLLRALMGPLTKPSLALTMAQSYLFDMISLSFEQLRDLRHRGAFSTVAQTFMTGCTQYLRSYPEGEPQLRTFYMATIATINGRTTINTRRSAGLPAMLAGLLAATPESSSLLTESVNDLISIANRPGNEADVDHQALPQVHALNCLREIFKHSKLGQRSSNRISDALHLAGTCLTSDLWGIRNSGLMLFRALLDRLLGSNDAFETSNRTKSNDVFTRHPQLQRMIYKLLEANVHDVDQTSAVERVFPALQLLYRAQPPQQQLQGTRAAVHKLIDCPHWLVRDKAARTIARLAQDDASSVLIHYCELKTTTQNSGHGRLLCLKHILDNALTQDEDLLLMVLGHMMQGLSSDNQFKSSAILRASALDVVVQCLRRLDAIASAQSAVDIIADRKVSQILQRGSQAQSMSAPMASFEFRSQALLFTHLQGSYSDLVETLQDLLAEDADALVVFLEEIGRSLRSCSNTSDLTILIRLLLGFLCDGPTLQPQVAIAAMDVLHAAKDRSSTRHMDRLDDLSAAWFTRLWIYSATPLTNDRALVTTGILLDLGLQQHSIEPRLTAQRIKAWLIQIRDAIHEDEPFDTRFAAVTALRKLDVGLLRLQNETVFQGALLDLCLIIYDLTNDDDDEVRCTGAALAGRLLVPANRRGKILVPLVAGSQLLSRTIRRGDSQRLGSIAIARLVSQSSHAIGEAVRDLLDEQLKTDKALFAEEKQNLFIDHAREARVWSKVLMSLPLGSVGRNQIHKMVNWACEGLQALGDLTRTSSGGPFSWSYNPDTFALGLRVIYSAQSLLHLQRQQRRLGVPSVEIRQLLSALLRQGRDRGLNNMWLKEIQKTVTQDLAHGVLRTGLILCSSGLDAA